MYSGNMRRFLLITLAVGVVIAGCTNNGGKSVDPTPSTSVSSNDQTLVLKVQNNTIVTGEGQTVYAFTEDQGDVSSCSGSCAQQYPAIQERDQVTAEPPLDDNLVATNDAGQVVYNGHPIYTCAVGQCANSAWATLDPNGNFTK
jgi:predicted lipoprotein with Yx(FWY)xxD motif